MRLITGQEVQLDKVRSMVQRGINYEDEDDEVLKETPIIDSAYVILPFQQQQVTQETTTERKKMKKAMGCLELCMFAEGSRHQEEIIVTGSKGRLEAYLPENKVYSFHRPSHKQWSDRSVPPPPDSIENNVYDCSNMKGVHNIDNNDEIPTHGGYHYCSTAVEWYKLLRAMKVHRETGAWEPLVSLNDGLKAVEIGLQATHSIVNKEN
jgi:myo-inositol 2-dehydrogenase / D-chiro-inositol 1-dehydrogenase